jgi:hypothetical protein
MLLCLCVSCFIHANDMTHFMRRAASGGAAARHSQSARACTDRNQHWNPNNSRKHFFSSLL